MVSASGLEWLRPRGEPRQNAVVGVETGAKQDHWSEDTRYRTPRHPRSRIRGDGQLLARMIVEKYSAFREGSAARSNVTTRVHSARRSQRESASIPAGASGREQPSGPGSGSTPCLNRGVAHAPTDSAGCEHPAAAGTKRRPQKGSSRSPEVAGAARIELCSASLKALAALDPAGCGLDAASAQLEVALM